MKKGLIVGACFLFIIIALVSVVSAGFFSDIWGKITGKAVGTIDLDGDGYFADGDGEIDCNDGDSNVNPGKAERCSNRIDDDCNDYTDCDDSSCTFSITCLSCVSCIYDGYGWCHSADFSGCTIESRYCSGDFIVDISICDESPTCDDGIQNGAETEIDCGGPCNACLPCTDTDIGFDPFNPGSATTGAGVDYNDLCNGNFLEEGICDTSVTYPLITGIGQNSVGGWYATVDCPSGCVTEDGEGYCADKAGACTDTDAMDYSTRGTVTLAGNAGPLDSERKDSCFTSPSRGLYYVVQEYYCSQVQGIRKELIYDCPCCGGENYENCEDTGVCMTTYTCDLTGSCSEIVVTCGDGVLNTPEECDDGNAVNTDACTNACKDNICGDGFLNTTGEECDDGNDVNTDACTNACIVQACVNDKQTYSLDGLNVDSECDVEFKLEVITSSLLTLGKTDFLVANKTVKKILNITVSATVSSATLDFTLDADDYRFPVNQLLIYVEDDVEPSGWSLLTDGTFSKKSGSLWEYTVSTSHFSLFLIVEPDYCGNDIFESNYYEECDNSINCTACACDSGYDADGSGNCVESIVDTGCSPEGAENCTGYTLYECGSDSKWDTKGIVVDKCGVQCLSGAKSCSGVISLLCGSDYELQTQGKISGLCGYVGTGNGDGEEDEEKRERNLKPLIIFLIVAAVLLVLIVMLLLLRRFREKTSSISTPTTIQNRTQNRTPRY